MTGVIDHLKARSAHAARRAALGAGATALIIVGAGFLTSAAWMLLAQMQSPLFAATVIGSAYVGVGLVCIGIVLSSSDHTPASTATSHSSENAKRAADLPPLAEAFVFGLNAGLSADQRRAKRPH